MAFILRLLTLCLMLNLALPAIAGNGVSKDDLDSQKELLLLKIDGNKEVLQKDLEAQGKRIDAIDKRVDDQVNRFGDLGFFAGLISTLITVVLAAAGLFGYFSVAKKAREEAEEVAETTSKKWFDENHKKLSDRIRELENAATQARSKIDSSVADVATHSKSAIETIQKNMATGTENNQQISAEDVAGLRASDKQLKDKPEANYSFDDWNTRAFAAYQAKQFEDAALFWKRAAEIPNVGAEKTAQTLFNRAVALSDLKRNEEAISTYDQVIDTYHADLAPAIRSFVARAMSNKGVTFTQMGDNDKAITTCSQVIDTYCADPSPAIREVVANSILNKGVAHSHMCDHDKAIATYEQVINTYRTDSAPAIRELVAKAMRNRGNRHSEMDEHDKAIASYEQVINTYRTDPAPAIREQLAKAMFNKGIAHRKLGDNDKAIATYEQVVDIYQADTTLSIRELVVNAMFNKGIAHNQIGDNNKEIAAYDQIIDAYHADSAPAIRERVANAMNGRGFNSLLTAKQALANQKEPEANELLHKALADLLAAIERKPEWGMALGNLAYAQWLLKLPAEAEASFRSALSSKEDSGEFLYKATLDDIAQHPIPEDASFREMVERLWAEYQAQKTNGN